MDVGEEFGPEATRVLLVLELGLAYAALQSAAAPKHIRDGFLTILAQLVRRRNAIDRGAHIANSILHVVFSEEARPVHVLKVLLLRRSAKYDGAALVHRRLV